MRLAWFHRAADAARPLTRDSTALLAELARTHEVEAFDRQRATDFPWRHFTRPYDLCVYEIDSPHVDFTTTYALHYPGLVLLRAPLLPDARLAGSSRIVAHDATVAERLRDTYPGATVDAVPMGIDRNLTTHRPREPRRPSADSVAFGVLGTENVGVAERAISRARAAGSTARLVACESLDTLLATDAVIAAEWPPAPEPPAEAIASMAAAMPVIVTESIVTAAWPAFDPQTWQPRGFGDLAPPIAVSIDPRDEEHSLVLAIRRLAAEPTLRRDIGDAARAWCERLPTTADAASAWTALLESVPVGQVSRPAVPEHVGQVFRPAKNGGESARAILDEFGVQLDIRV